MAGRAGKRRRVQIPVQVPVQVPVQIPVQVPVQIPVGEVEIRSLDMYELAAVGGAR